MSAHRATPSLCSRKCLRPALPWQSGVPSGGGWDRCHFPPVGELQADIRVGAQGNHFGFLVNALPEAPPLAPLGSDQKG